MRRTAKILLERLEAGFDGAFTPAWNPLYHLGTLAFFFFWIVAVSGIYLYIVFDTGVTRAYQSVEYLTHVQWYAGGVMRSLHRYASDALLVVMMLHLVREFVLDRFRGTRWFAWITGVPILWFVFASGISGYWLVWDKLAQYVAIVSTEWLDSLPIFGEPIARNFLNQTALSDRFFTLMVFLHIVVPLFLLFIMWIHLQRLSRPKVNPPRGLAAGTLGMLVALSLAWPAVSQGPADLDVVPAEVRLDWFYLPLYPLLDRIPGGLLWAAVGLGTLLLFCLPWLPPKRREPVAVVDLANCNGCGRCVADCPFNAVTMRPRTDALPFGDQAVVSADLCLSCGICMGACPPSTPFRRTTDLVTGIDLPGFSLRELRDRTLAAVGRLSGDGRILVYACDHGADLGRFESSAVSGVSLPCVAMLPPSFLDFVITRKHADGVLLTGCREGDCHHRLGIDWMEQRMDRRRDPFLRDRVPRERIAKCWSGLAEPERLARELEAFRTRLTALGPLEETRPSPRAGAVPARESGHG